jgi:hypothetical protein
MYRMTHARRRRKEAKGVPNIPSHTPPSFFDGKTRLFGPTLRCLQLTLSSKRCQRCIALGARDVLLKELSVEVTTGGVSPAGSGEARSE